MHKLRIGWVAVGSLLFVVGAANAASQGQYAEGVYAEYAAGSNYKISFDVKTLSAGNLTEIAKIPFNELIAPSDHQVDAWQVGTEIRSPQYAAAFPNLFQSQEMTSSAANFENVGYPVKDGAYRMLEVTTTIGGDVKQHQAIEFCWATLAHCVVLDPTVLFVDSMVQNRQRLAAEGWGVTVQETSGTPGISSVCGLASNPSVTSRSFYWGGYTIQYKDVFGIVLVSKSLGSQQSGIRCNTSCQPAPFGYSNASSCQGFLGWTCDCDNDFGYGTTGSTGTWISETKCTHKWALQADASASISNLGSASVSINWVLNGTPDANGGKMMDTCGFY